MSIKCKYCGRDYDATLFEFNRTITCVCGEVVTFKHERMMNEGILEREEEDEKSKSDDSS